MSCVAFFITPYSLLINTGFLRFARNDKQEADGYCAEQDHNIERTHLSTQPSHCVGFFTAPCFNSLFLGRVDKIKLERTVILNGA